MCKEGRENKSLHEICFVRKVTGWALLQDPASKSLPIPVHWATDTQGWHNQGNVDPDDPKWVSLLPSGVFTGGSWCFPRSSAPVQALQTQHWQPKRQQKPPRKLWNVINFMPKVIVTTVKFCLLENKPGRKFKIYSHFKIIHFHQKFCLGVEFWDSWNQQVIVTERCRGEKIIGSICPRKVLTFHVKKSDAVCFWCLINKGHLPPPSSMSETPF